MSTILEKAAPITGQDGNVGVPVTENTAKTTADSTRIADENKGSVAPGTVENGVPVPAPAEQTLEPEVAEQPPEKGVPDNGGADTEGVPQKRVERLKLSDIEVPEGRRNVDDAKVVALMREIRRNGLINNIAVRKCGDKYVLVAGEHRRQAYELLGLEYIECTVLECDDIQAAIIEITENMVRSELHPVEIGEYAREWFDLLHKQGKRAQRGDNQHSVGGGAGVAPPLTTAALAKEIGISERSLQEHLQLVDALTFEARRAVVAGKVPKNIAVALSRLEPEDQNKVVAEGEITLDAIEAYHPKSAKGTGTQQKSNKAEFKRTEKKLQGVATSVDGSVELFAKASSLADGDKQKTELKEVADKVYASCTSLAGLLRREYGADLPLDNAGK